MSKSQTDPIEHFLLWDPATKRTYVFTKTASIANIVLAQGTIAEQPAPTGENTPTLRFYARAGYRDLTDTLATWRKHNPQVASPRDLNAQALRRKALVAVIENEIATLRDHPRKDEPVPNQDQPIDEHVDIPGYTYTPDDPRYPDVEIQLLGMPGKLLTILAEADRELKRAGVPSERRFEMFAEATKAGGFDAGLRVVMTWVSWQPSAEDDD